MKCDNYACRKDSDQLIEVGYGGYWLCQKCASIRKYEEEMEIRWLKHLEFLANLAKREMEIRWSDRSDFFAQHFQKMMIPAEGDHPVERRIKLMNFYLFKRQFIKRELRYTKPVFWNLAMIERIEKLIEQTDIYCDQHWLGHPFYDVKWEEKFAELTDDFISELMKWETELTDDFLLELNHDF